MRPAMPPCLDDLLIRLVVDLDGRDRLLHVAEDHVKVLVVRLEGPGKSEGVQKQT